MTALRITTLTRSLLAYTDQTVPNARALYQGAVNAKFPAHQVNGIWHYNVADLPMIAAAYGLKPKAAVQPRRRSQRATSTPILAA